MDYDEVKYLIRAEVKDAIGNYVGLLPTRDEFYTMMDRVMKELQDIRNEMAFMSGRLDRVEKK